MPGNSEKLSLSDTAERYQDKLFHVLKAAVPIPAWIPIYGILKRPRDAKWSQFRDLITLNAELHRSILPDAVEALLSTLPTPQTAEGKLLKQSLLDGVANVTSPTGTQSTLPDIFTEADELAVRNFVLQTSKSVPLEYYPFQRMQQFARSIISAAQNNWSESLGTANPAKVNAFMNTVPEGFAVQPILIDNPSGESRFGFRVGTSETAESFVIVTDPVANRELSDAVLHDRLLLRYFLAVEVAQLQAQLAYPIDVMISEIIALWLENPLECLEQHQLQTIIHGLRLVQKLQYTPVTLISEELQLYPRTTTQPHYTDVVYSVDKTLNYDAQEPLECTFKLSFCSAYPELVGAEVHVSVDITDGSIMLRKPGAKYPVELFEAALSMDHGKSLHILACYLLNWTPNLPLRLPENANELAIFATAFAQICAELKNTRSFKEFHFLSTTR